MAPPDRQRIALAVLIEAGDQTEQEPARRELIELRQLLGQDER